MASAREETKGRVRIQIDGWDDWKWGGGIMEGQGGGNRKGGYWWSGEPAGGDANMALRAKEVARVAELEVGGCFRGRV